MSRESILKAVKKNQPSGRVLPEVPTLLRLSFEDKVSKFREVFTGIGGRLIPLNEGEDLHDLIVQVYENPPVIISVSPRVGFEPLPTDATGQPHVLEQVDVAVIDAQFAVAENGAIWVTEDQYKVRALPFICTHLAAIVSRQSLLDDMHQAYERIGMAEYGFGMFIAGPSKTADIEQSLVLGAHGPKSMTIFLV